MLAEPTSIDVCFGGRIPRFSDYSVYDDFAGSADFTGPAKSAKTSLTEKDILE